MINKIEISGFKSINELVLELKPINLFIGSNGVGKSNFISVFKLINTVYEQRLGTYSMKYGADNILHFGRKETGDLSVYVSFDNINAYRFVLKPNAEGGLFVETESKYFNPRIYGSSGWQSISVGANQQEANIKSDHTNIGFYVKQYLESFRVYHFHDTSENASLRIPSEIDDNQYLRENGSNLASFLYYLQEKHPANFKRIESTVSSVAPFFERFKLAPQRLNEGRIQLEWTEVGHPERYFNASHLSDGTLRFIALATLLLQPEPPAVIIIDEPELGLHPVAINKLAGMLRAAEGKKCQIIVSTQSVGLVNNFNADEIVTVDRVGEESKFIRLEQADLEQWLGDYSIGDLWSKNIIQGQP